jgi:hypothetical protein
MKIVILVVAIGAVLCLALVDLGLQEKYDALKADNDARGADNAKVRAANDKLTARVELDIKRITTLEAEQSRLHGQILDLQANLARGVPAPLTVGPGPQSPPLLAADPVPAISAAPAALAVTVEMSKAEQEKLRNMLSWLRSNKACVSCRGTGLISGMCCGDCAAKIRYRVSTGGHYSGGWVPTYEDRFRGNGLTPLIGLRKSLDSVLGLCQQYADTIPPELLAAARNTCCDIDPKMATQFPGGPVPVAPTPAVVPPPRGPTKK